MLENRPRTVLRVAGFLLSSTINKMLRYRKHLVFAEVEKLMDAAEP
jgi:hypothetical protein